MIRLLTYQLLFQKHDFPIPDLQLSWYSWTKLSHVLDYKLFYGYFEEFDPNTGYGNPVTPKWLLANQVTAGKKMDRDGPSDFNRSNQLWGRWRSI